MGGVDGVVMDIAFEQVLGGALAVVLFVVAGWFFLCRGSSSHAVQSVSVVQPPGVLPKSTVWRFTDVSFLVQLGSPVSGGAETFASDAVVVVQNGADPASLDFEPVKKAWVCAANPVTLAPSRAAASVKGDTTSSTSQSDVNRESDAGESSVAADDSDDNQHLSETSFVLRLSVRDLVKIGFANLDRANVYVLSGALAVKFVNESSAGRLAILSGSNGGDNGGTNTKDNNIRGKSIPCAQVSIFPAAAHGSHVLRCEDKTRAEIRARIESLRNDSSNTAVAVRTKLRELLDVTGVDGGESESTTAVTLDDRLRCTVDYSPNALDSAYAMLLPCDDFVVNQPSEDILRKLDYEAKRAGKLRLQSFNHFFFLSVLVVASNFGRRVNAIVFRGRSVHSR